MFSEFIGGRSERIERIPDRLRTAFSKAARLDRPAPSTQIPMWVTSPGSPARGSVAALGGWRTVSFQALRGRGTSALSACPFRDRCFAARLEQYKVPDNVGRALFFLKGIRCHVVLLWTG